MRPALLVAILAACGSAPGAAPQPATPPPPPPAAVPANQPAGPPAPAPPADAPTPYTTEQLREGCPAGRVITFRREAPAAPTSFLVLRFVTVDDTGADVESLTRDEQGNLLEPAKIQHATWEELRSHGRFPRAATTIEDGVADTPAGSFRSRVYVVQRGDEVTHFYFAVDRPGPPVLFYTERAGVRIATNTQVPELAPAISCKADDDCWISDDGKPIERPRKLRGKKLRPCKDRERIPACQANVCIVRAYKC